MPRLLPSLVLALAAVTPLASAETIVTGVSVGPGVTGVPLRRNINDLQAEGGPKWDLLIQALAEMQKADVNDELSYYQIMGIHGEPYVEWNGAGPSNGVASSYCPHGETIFLPWHRPYVMVFEQALVNHARRLAKQYPEAQRSQYMQAAEEIRAPYWDWAADTGIPPVMVPAKIQVNIADGGAVKRANIDNPYAGYKFPSAASSFTQSTQITRCPTPESWPESANDNTNDAAYKEAVDNVFLKADTFYKVSTKANSGLSFETPHDNIHGEATCGQQFSDARYAAFDPLFMLHHANVDRLWAYWQAMNPNETDFPTYGSNRRFSTPQGTETTPNSPLKPFFASEGVFHTSMSVSNIDGLGYSYEGLEYWAKSVDQMRRDARSLTTSLYAPSRRQRSQLSRRNGGSLLDKPFTTEFSVSLEVDTTEMDLPCKIKLYIDDEKVGRYTILAHSSRGKVYGNIPITDPLERITNRKLSPDEMLDELESRLTVEIVKPDGSLVPVSSAPSLKIDIEKCKVTIPDTDEEAPEVGDSSRRRMRTKEKGKGKGEGSTAV